MPKLLLGVIFDPCYGRDVSVLVFMRSAEYPTDEMILILPVRQHSWEEEGRAQTLDPVDIQYG